MVGWIVPPPRRLEKTKAEFSEERVAKVTWLIDEGFLRSEGITKAMLKVPRAAFALDSSIKEFRDKEKSAES